MSNNQHSATHPVLDLSIDEVLTTTRNVRKRLDFSRPVPRSVIEECLTLALQAPCHGEFGGICPKHVKAAP